MMKVMVDDYVLPNEDDVQHEAANDAAAHINLN
jgi:hypothetical protein